MLARRLKGVTEGLRGARERYIRGLGRGLNIATVGLRVSTTLELGLLGLLADSCIVLFG